MVRGVCRFRARFLLMGHTLLSGSGLGQLHRILKLTFSDCCQSYWTEDAPNPKMTTGPIATAI